jgi:hypothetical protein
LASAGLQFKDSLCLDAQKGQPFRRVGSRNFSGRGSGYRRRCEAYQASSEMPAPPRSPLHGASEASTCIFESRMDYFRAGGGWKELLFHHGRWRSKFIPHFALLYYAVCRELCRWTSVQHGVPH